MKSFKSFIFTVRLNHKFKNEFVLKYLQYSFLTCLLYKLTDACSKWWKVGSHEKFAVNVSNRNPVNLWTDELESWKPGFKTWKSVLGRVRCSVSYIISYCYWLQRALLQLATRWKTVLNKKGIMTGWEGLWCRTYNSWYKNGQALSLNCFWGKEKFAYATAILNNNSTYHKL